MILQAKEGATVHALLFTMDLGGLQAWLLVSHRMRWRRQASMKPHDQGFERGRVVLCDHMTLGLPYFPVLSGKALVGWKEPRWGER